MVKQTLSTVETVVPTSKNTERTWYGPSLRVLRSEAFIAALFLIGVLVFFYWGIIVEGHTFLTEGSPIVHGTMPKPHPGPYGYDGPRDIRYWDTNALSTSVEPWDYFIAKSYQSGQIPLWNPHQGLGIPLHANGLTGMFDPLKLLIIYFAPIKWWSYAMDLHLLVRYFLAGFFTYLFVRTLGVSLVGALAAAVAYMLSTYLIMFGSISFIRLDTLLPLLMYAYHRLANKPAWGSFYLVAFSTYMLIVGDFPEHLPLHLGFALSWYGFQAFLLAQHSTDKYRLWGKLVLYSVAATITGILLGIFVLLPFIQFWASAFHIHTPDLLQSLDVTSPWPITAMGGFFVSSLRWIGRLRIISVAIVIFTLLTLLQTRFNNLNYKQTAKYALFFASMSILIILVSYRVLIFETIANLPPLNMIFLNRSTQPYLLFSLACITGIGLDYMCSAVVRMRMRSAILSVIIAIILVVLSIYGIAAEIPSILNRTLDILIIPIVFLLLFSIIVNLAVRGPMGSRLAGIVIVFLLVVEAKAYQQFRDPLRYDLYTEPPFVSFLRTIDTPYRIVGTDSIIHANVSTAYGIDDARYTDALSPNRLFKFHQRFLTLPTEPVWENQIQFDGDTAPLLFDKAMDMLNVQYIFTLSSKVPQSAYIDPSPFKLVHSSVGVDVYLNRNAYPRAYVVHAAEVIPDFNAILDRFAAKDFDPSRSVILAQAPPAAFMQSLPQQAVPYQKADVLARDTGEMLVRAKLDRPGFLVVSELDYPGWEATVDDQPAPIYSAYGFMRSVALDAGTHTVKFQYRPQSFMIGVAISFSTLLILIVTTAWWLLRTRRGNLVTRVPNGF